MEEEKFQDLKGEDDYDDNKTPNNDDDDEEERFVDADKVEEGKKPQQNKPAASWVHHQNLEGKYDLILVYAV